MKRQKPLESRKSFLWLHYLVFDDKRLRASDIVVYAALARYANNETARCYPSMETLAKEARLEEKTIRSALKRLKKWKYIEIDEKVGRVNIYTLLEPQPNKHNTEAKKEDTPEPIEPPQKLEGYEKPPTPLPNGTYEQYSTNNTIVSKDTTQEPSSSHKPNDIPRIIKLFEAINPTADSLYKKPPQREAALRLLQKFGEAEIARRIEALVYFKGHKFRPSIYTPYELETHWAKLDEFLERNEYGY